MKDTETTDVIFRTFKEGDVIAVMPHEVSNFGFVTSYMHVGQHGDADYNQVLKETRLATKEEYADLLRELESIGYKVRVLKKQSYKKYQQARIEYTNHINNLRNNTNKSS